MRRFLFQILLLSFLLVGAATNVLAQNSQGGVVSIITEDAKSNIKIYPNPVEDYFQINIDVGISVEYISISDIFGKQILRYKAVTGHRYSVSDLRKGMYIVRILGPDDSLIKVMRLNKA
jgi:hypothetical protein